MREGALVRGTPDVCPDRVLARRLGVIPTHTAGRPAVQTDRRPTDAIDERRRYRQLNKMIIGWRSRGFLGAILCYSVDGLRGDRAYHRPRHRPCLFREVHWLAGHVPGSTTKQETTGHASSVRNGPCDGAVTQTDPGITYLARGVGRAAAVGSGHSCSVAVSV